MEAVLMPIKKRVLEDKLKAWCVDHAADLEHQQTPLGERYEIVWRTPDEVRFIDVYPRGAEHVILQRGAHATGVATEDQREKGPVYNRRPEEVVDTLTDLAPFARPYTRR